MEYKLTVTHDPDMECPDNDCWKVLSFNRKHINFADMSKLDTDDLSQKCVAGLAFPLSYYEHGLCRWSLGGTGPSDRFDSVAFAGILEWIGEHEDSRTAEQRREMAKEYLERYTEWCNGSVYWVQLEAIGRETCPTCHHEAVEGTEVYSCGNIYKISEAVEDFKEMLNEGDVIEVVGEAEFLIDSDTLKPATLKKTKRGG